MTDIHVREFEQPTSKSRPKSPPKSPAIPVPFYYAPSNDGTDENILILLHGLGDTHVPFSKLGRQLKLPQTAVLALRAPEQIPYLYAESYQWYPSFDLFGLPLPHPNPTPALNLLSGVITHLTQDCAWPVNRIHLFGFGQGGSVASEFGLRWWRKQLELVLQTKRDTDDAHHSSPSLPVALGSIVSISGPLLSYPTLSKVCPTPLLIFHRPNPNASSDDESEALPSGAIMTLKKAYVTVVEVHKIGRGMPSSKDEWEPIMRFWSERLGRSSDGLYEVMSGINVPH